jgi:POT family proton-dependent oligopeptide transporter
MVYSAVLEHYIYLGSPCQNDEPSTCKDPDGNPFPAKINVWVVSGPYILVALSEMFTSITSIEYAFTKVNTKFVSQLNSLPKAD